MNESRKARYSAGRITAVVLAVFLLYILSPGPVLLLRGKGYIPHHWDGLLQAMYCPFRAVFRICPPAGEFYFTWYVGKVWRVDFNLGLGDSEPR